MKFLISIFFIITLLTSEKEVKGKVYDEYIETIEGVTIEFNNHKITTDAEGNFSLDGIEQFPIKVKFSKEGFESKEVEVEEQADDLEIVLMEL